jgi:two-component system, NarL family, nitrate/nitrite response regulator NarL
MTIVNLAVSHRIAAAEVLEELRSGAAPGGPKTSHYVTHLTVNWHHDHVSIRCLLVDDNDAFLKAASVLLQREGVTVVGVASNTAGALRQALALRPDVILVDIGLGDESGFDLARLLTQDGQGCSAKVILISTHAEVDYAGLIAESPAAGFLVKSDLSARAIGQILGHGP